LDRCQTNYSAHVKPFGLSLAHLPILVIFMKLVQLICRRTTVALHGGHFTAILLPAKTRI
jgi:hypothetical protein